jgi:beta-1,4-N-acetylglucosaminyltransferase
MEVFTLKPTLADYLNRADLIISHSGAGTILEVLKLGKPLIVVVNETLMHNHQTELATALDEENYLLSSTCKTLINVLLIFVYIFSILGY